MNGGNGGYISSKIEVTPDQILTVVLSYAADIRKQPGTLQDRLVVAGEGGWGWQGNPGDQTCNGWATKGGAGGGLVGGAGEFVPCKDKGCTEGLGGTQTAGGKNGNCQSSAPGTFGYGGIGGGWAGRGGDGWYGGGGGGQSYGGGGGSSYSAPGSTILLNNQGYYGSYLSRLYITITRCLPGYSITSTTACIICGEGKFSNNVTCTNCPAGKFNPFTGKTSCLQCSDAPEGSYFCSQPTGQPTRQPTRQPTSQPSTQPSAFPSSQPSNQPTNQPSSQPTCFPTFLNNHSAKYKEYEFGLSTTNSNKNYEGSVLIGNLGLASERSIYLSLLLWPSGFANGYVLFSTFDGIALPSAPGTGPVAGSCQPTTNIGLLNTSACENVFYPCHINLDVTKYIRTEEGGSLLIKTVATFGPSTSAILPCRKSISVKDPTYALYPKFVIGDKKYGECELGKYFQACAVTSLECESCFKCPSGKYSNTPIYDKTKCFFCEAGKYSMAGSTECRPCEVGTFTSTSGASLQSCPVATYADTVGATQCTSCPTGKTTAAEGSTLATDCISTVFNFISGFIAFLIAAPLALQ